MLLKSGLVEIPTLGDGVELLFIIMDSMINNNILDALKYSDEI